MLQNCQAIYEKTDKAGNSETLCFRHSPTKLTRQHPSSLGTAHSIKRRNVSISPQHPQYIISGGEPFHPTGKIRGTGHSTMKS
jgi:hypothetical protein